MSALAEFLQQAGKQWQDAAPAREATITEWKGAVTELLGKIKEWVLASDPHKVMQFEPKTVERIESRLGRYEIPAVTLRFGPRWVHIVPIARYTIVSLATAAGAAEQLAAGCVAISDNPSLDSAYPDYRLYRLNEPPADRWFVSAGGPPDVELTREVFERILVDLLK